MPDIVALTVTFPAQIITNLGVAVPGPAGATGAAGAAGPAGGYDPSLPLYLKAPNLHYWRLEITNAGALTSTDIGLTLP